MEEAQLEILASNRETLIRSIDVDRITQSLVDEDVLTDDDVDFIRGGGRGDSPSRVAKTGRLLDVLPLRGAGAFDSLCSAIQRTDPHLLTLMFLGRPPPPPISGEDSPEKNSVASSIEIDDDDDDDENRDDDDDDVDLEDDIDDLDDVIGVDGDASPEVASFVSSSPALNQDDDDDDDDDVRRDDANSPLTDGVADDDPAFSATPPVSGVVVRDAAVSNSAHFPPLPVAAFGAPAAAPRSSANGYAAPGNLGVPLPPTNHTNGANPITIQQRNSRSILDDPQHQQPPNRIDPQQHQPPQRHHNHQQHPIHDQPPQHQLRHDHQPEQQHHRDPQQQQPHHDLHPTSRYPPASMGPMGGVPVLPVAPPPAPAAAPPAQPPPPPPPQPQPDAASSYYDPSQFPVLPPHPNHLAHPNHHPGQHPHLHHQHQHHQIPGFSQTLPRGSSVPPPPPPPQQQQPQQHHANQEYEFLKAQCDRAIKELQSLKIQNADTVKKLELSNKEADFFKKIWQRERDAASAGVGAAVHVSGRGVRGGALHAGYRYGDLNKSEQTLAFTDFHGNEGKAGTEGSLDRDRQEIQELRRSFLGPSGERNGADGDRSSKKHIFGDQRLLASILDKYESQKNELDAFKNKYEMLVKDLEIALNSLEIMKEDNIRFKKQLEEIESDRNQVIQERNGLRQQCNAAIKQWVELREALQKTKAQRDELEKEINQAMAVRLKATKDLQRISEEKNATEQEYSLVMAERDSVHKEMEQLTDRLNAASAAAEAEKVARLRLEEGMETMRRQLRAALDERDGALSECNALVKDFLGEKVEDFEDIEGFRGSYATLGYQFRSTQEELARTKDEYAGALVELDSWRHQSEETSGEVEQKERQIAALQRELESLRAESEEAKSQRDWSFAERDKIVMERDSIRKQVDQLRKEKDQTLGKLANSYRETDESRRARSNLAKELTELREKLAALEGDRSGAAGVLPSSASSQRLLASISSTAVGAAPLDRSPTRDAGSEDAGAAEVVAALEPGAAVPVERGLFFTAPAASKSAAGSEAGFGAAIQGDRIVSVDGVVVGRENIDELEKLLATGQATTVSLLRLPSLAPASSRSAGRPDAGQFHPDAGQFHPESGQFYPDAAQMPGEKETGKGGTYAAAVMKGSGNVEGDIISSSSRNGASESSSSCCGSSTGPSPAHQQHSGMQQPSPAHQQQHPGMQHPQHLAKGLPYQSVPSLQEHQRASWHSWNQEPSVPHQPISAANHFDGSTRHHHHHHYTHRHHPLHHPNHPDIPMENLLDKAHKELQQKYATLDVGRLRGTRARPPLSNITRGGEAGRTEASVNGRGDASPNRPRSLATELSAAMEPPASTEEQLDEQQVIADFEYIVSQCAKSTEERRGSSRSSSKRSSGRSVTSPSEFRKLAAGGGVSPRTSGRDKASSSAGSNAGSVTGSAVGVAARAASPRGSMGAGRQKPAASGGGGNSGGSGGNAGNGGTWPRYRMPPPDGAPDDSSSSVSPLESSPAHAATDAASALSPQLPPKKTQQQPQLQQTSQQETLDGSSVGSKTSQQQPQLRHAATHHAASARKKDRKSVKSFFAFSSSNGRTSPSNLSSPNSPPTSPTHNPASAASQARQQGSDPSHSSGKSHGWTGVVMGCNPWKKERRNDDDDEDDDGDADGVNSVSDGLPRGALEASPARHSIRSGKSSDGDGGSPFHHSRLSAEGNPDDDDPTSSPFRSPLSSHEVSKEADESIDYTGIVAALGGDSSAANTPDVETPRPFPGRQTISPTRGSTRHPPPPPPTMTTKSASRSPPMKLAAPPAVAASRGAKSYAQDSRPASLVVSSSSSADNFDNKRTSTGQQSHQQQRARPQSQTYQSPNDSVTSANSRIPFMPSNFHGHVTTTNAYGTPVAPPPSYPMAPYGVASAGYPGATAAPLLGPPPASPRDADTGERGVVAVPMGGAGDVEIPSGAGRRRGAGGRREETPGRHFSPGEPPTPRPPPPHPLDVAAVVHAPFGAAPPGHPLAPSPAPLPAPSPAPWIFEAAPGGQHFVHDSRSYSTLPSSHSRQNNLAHSRSGTGFYAPSTHGGSVLSSSSGAGINSISGGAMTMSTSGRIRIPSNQSVNSKGSTTDRSSPMSPSLTASSGGVDRTSGFAVDRVSGFGVPASASSSSIAARYHDAGAISPRGALPPSGAGSLATPPLPEEGEIRRVTVHDKPIGIQIKERGHNQGVFVSSVTEKSNAALAGIFVGDQLLEVCALNLRLASYELAANVLRNVGDSVDILVQYNPKGYAAISDSSTNGLSSPSSPTSLSSARRRSPASSSAPTSASPSRHVAPFAPSGALGRARWATIEGRATTAFSSIVETVGLILCGGNLVGVFVREVVEGSPADVAVVVADAASDSADAERNKGEERIKSGDQILEVNGIDIRDATLEATTILLGRFGDSLRLKIQHNPDKFMQMKELPGGDGFYIRSLFDRILPESHNNNNNNDGGGGGGGEVEVLSFKKDDVLFVDNTVHGGVLGVWHAWLVDDDANRQKCGTVPSRIRLDEDLGPRFLTDPFDADSPSLDFFKTSSSARTSGRSSGGKGGATGGGVRSSGGKGAAAGSASASGARRSFFKRKKSSPSSSSSSGGGGVKPEVGVAGSSSAAAASSSSKDQQQKAADSASLSSLGMDGGGGAVLSLVELERFGSSYQRVERLENVNRRPLILLGPLKEQVGLKMTVDFPREFDLARPEILTPHDALALCGPGGVADDEEWIVVAQEMTSSKGHSSQTTLVKAVDIKKIRDICAPAGAPEGAGKHPVLDPGSGVTGAPPSITSGAVLQSALQRLHQKRLYPIVILIKFASSKSVKEVKLPKDKISKSEAKEMMEAASRLESEWRHLLTASIAGASLQQMTSAVKTIVGIEQEKTLWVPI